MAMRRVGALLLTAALMVVLGTGLLLSGIARAEGDDTVTASGETAEWSAGAQAGYSGGEMLSSGSSRESAGGTVDNRLLVLLTVAACVSGAAAITMASPRVGEEG